MEQEDQIILEFGLVAALNLRITRIIQQFVTATTITAIIVVIAVIIVLAFVTVIAIPEYFG